MARKNTRRGAAAGRPAKAPRQAKAAAAVPERFTRSAEVQAVATEQSEIERVRQERIAKHQEAIRQSRIGVEAAAVRPLNIFAEGNSWFDYPFPLPFGGDVVDKIEDLATIKPLVLNLAHHGDMSTEMLGVAQRKRIIQNLGNPANGRFDAILFSGGGNDLVGDLFCLWLNDKTPGLAPAYGVNRPRLAAIMGVVQAAFEDLVAIRNAANPDIVIFVHAYDFVFPDGRPVCPGVGPWLKLSLDLRGWTNPTQAKAIVDEVLGAFDPMLVRLSQDHQNVVYVRTQGTLTSHLDDWANELHPTPDGFKKVARVFRRALAARFPGRI